MVRLSTSMESSNQSKVTQEDLPQGGEPSESVEETEDVVEGDTIHTTNEAVSLANY